MSKPRLLLARLCNRIEYDGVGPRQHIPFSCLLGCMRSLNGFTIISNIALYLKGSPCLKFLVTQQNDTEIFPGTL